MIATARAVTEASQQEKSAGSQGTGPSSNPGVLARERRVHLPRSGSARQSDSFSDQADTPRSLEPILILKL